MKYGVMWLALLVVSPAITGCRSNAESPKDGAPFVIDPTCSSQDAGARREEKPVGACEKDAECRFHTPARECRPGMTVAASVPNEWHCTCPDGEWSCDVTAGGLGLVPCPDAGAADAEPVDDAGDGS